MPGDDLILEPGGPARAALVWLHGLGAAAADFADLHDRLGVPGLRVLLPQAPTRPVAVFGGAAAPAWCDLVPQPDGGILSDRAGLEETAARVRAALDRQAAAGIDRLAVGGYSQGAAAALYCALTRPDGLAAAAGLSGYLPQDAWLEEHADARAWRIPFFPRPRPRRRGGAARIRRGEPRLAAAARRRSRMVRGRLRARGARGGTGRAGRLPARPARLRRPEIRRNRGLAGYTSAAVSVPHSAVSAAARRPLWLPLLLALGAAPDAGAFPWQRDAEAAPSLAPMLERTMPAVVNISTARAELVRAAPLFRDPFFQHFFGRHGPRKRVRRGLGTGVILDAARGHVVTNHHLIARADDITVTLHDGRELRAELIGADPATDVAMLRVAADGLADLPLAAPEELRVGDYVVAIGNPFGLGQTVTSGIVSALGRTGVFDAHGYENFIQTDASINPGNSGGALVNLRGELVGINTAILSRSGGNIGIGFAIPARMVRRVADQLIEHGGVDRGRLGVRGQDLDPELADAFGVDGGVAVTEVLPDLPGRARRHPPGRRGAKHRRRAGAPPGRPAPGAGPAARRPRGRDRAGARRPHPHRARRHRGAGERGRAPASGPRRPDPGRGPRRRRRDRDRGAGGRRRTPRPRAPACAPATNCARSTAARCAASRNCAPPPAAARRGCWCSSAAAPAPAGCCCPEPMRGRGTGAPAQRDLRRTQRRLALLGGLGGVLLLALLARIGWMQTVHSERFALLAEGNHLRSLPVPPPRGLIFDRRGELLADNRAQYGLAVVPAQAGDLDATLAELRTLVDIQDWERRAFARAARRSRHRGATLRLDLDDAELARAAARAATACPACRWTPIPRAATRAARRWRTCSAT